MSETAERPASARHVETWAQILGQVLGEIAGSPVPSAALFEPPAQLSPAAENDLWIVAACSGGLRGEMGIRLPSAAVVHLAQIFMGEPLVPGTEMTPAHREAVVELLRQVSGLVVTAIKAAWGEVQLRPEAAGGPPSWPASSTAWIRIGDPAAAASLVELQLSAALTAALRAEASDFVPLPAPSTAACSPGISAPASPQANPVNLDLLMDVELAVTLRFGSRRLLLREVLDLNPGSVVDLDRQVEEPVDMLLDGRVVARGELVIMDGNYGLRVTEVAPRSGASA